VRSKPGRTDDAKRILAAFGMPRAQQNPNAIYTLLAFADIGPRTSWSRAGSPRRTPHDVIAFAAEKYGKSYAENTRETIRRQAIHQFVQGGILVRNPDEPGLATNSPRTHYALTPEALQVLRLYGTLDFEAAAAAFRSSQAGGLAERYARPRRFEGLTLTIPEHGTVSLSPGVHNRLQAQIIEQFVPRFAPGARVLYLGDTDDKIRIFDALRLDQVGVPVTKHDKLPDLVLIDEKRGWLFLIEAVTSHGPVNAKRHLELQNVLTSSTVGRVFVSAFPSFHEFKKYAAEIAWETEVWVAESPDHLLHYNGDRFLGPRF
jgi:hypothetical protein